jgi:formylglycine-generating enzyme required for sulfatase activity
LERLRAGGKGSTRQDLPQVSIVTAREKSNSELQGSPNDERISNSLEMEFVKLPRTNVWMCVHETRIKDWEEYSKEVPSERIHPSLLLFRGKHVGETGEHPVVRVSALEAEAFVKWLNQREANPWKYYRLPTDHEWSVAVGIGECEDERATPERNAKRWKNKKPVYPWGNQWPPPKGSGNYADETAKGAFPNWDVISGYWDGYATTSPVKRFAPNSLGIYDLGGNCWEWTSSLWDGKNAGWRVLRGGSWGNKSEPELRSSCRIFRDPTTRYLSVGLRCVLVTSDG